MLHVWTRAIALAHQNAVIYADAAQHGYGLTRDDQAVLYRSYRARAERVAAALYARSRR